VARPEGGEKGVGQSEVDFDGVRLGHCKTNPLGIGTHLIVIDGESAVEDHIINAVKRGSTESELFALRSERRGCRPGRNSQDDVVMRIDVFVEAELLAMGIPALVLEIEIAAIGRLVGKHLTARHSEVVHDALFQCQVKMLLGILLHLKPVFIHESEIFDQVGIFQINQDADLAAIGWIENRAQQTFETEWRIGSFFRMENNVVG
jgi:hypothetical protein